VNPMRSCPNCGTANSETAKFCQECAEALSAPSEARRRLITAVFCDLVGSTEPAERLDAEVLRKLLDRYFEAMRTAIERHGGTFEKFIGDAVVGAFGVPTAHEDDAVRAVRAALEMRGAASELDAEIADRDVRVRVRIGIDSGEALADEASARQGRIAGGVFNTAARLQGAAEPGSIVVSGTAERMLRGHVELEAISTLELKGKALPVQAFRVVELRGAPTRIETPLVGRDRALASLTGALEDAIDADACVLVTVLASAGVGKSRLADAFAGVAGDRATVLVGQTPSYGDGVTFAPLAELMAEAAGRPSGEAARSPPRSGNDWPDNRTPRPWGTGSPRSSVSGRRSPGTPRGPFAVCSR
jgi:class 3 adenylate cyclase